MHRALPDQAPSHDAGAAPKRCLARLTTSCGRGLAALAASTLAAHSSAQWKSDQEACGRSSLSAEQRIEVCTRMLQAADLPASEQAKAYNNLGVAWKAKGDIDQAIANYQRAIAIEPRFANAYANLGVALGAKGDLDG